MDALRLFTPAPTMGDVYSLALYPARSSHRGLTPEARAALGIGDDLVRLSVGSRAWPTCSGTSIGRCRRDHRHAGRARARSGPAPGAPGDGGHQDAQRAPLTARARGPEALHHQAGQEGPIGAPPMAIASSPIARPRMAGLVGRG